MDMCYNTNVVKRDYEISKEGGKREWNASQGRFARPAKVLVIILILAVLVSAQVRLSRMMMMAMKSLSPVILVAGLVLIIPAPPAAELA